MSSPLNKQLRWTAHTEINTFHSCRFFVPIVNLDLLYFVDTEDFIVPPERTTTCLRVSRVIRPTCNQSYGTRYPVLHTRVHVLSLPGPLLYTLTSAPTLALS
ncbi:unnamed protein product, partial [Ectocarpus sp. 13 AM-2016]